MIQNCLIQRENSDSKCHSCTFHEMVAFKHPPLTSIRFKIMFLFLGTLRPASLFLYPPCPPQPSINPQKVCTTRKPAKNLTTSQLTDWPADLWGPPIRIVETWPIATLVMELKSTMDKEPHTPQLKLKCKFNKTRMTTFIKTKFKVSDDQTNIDKYRI